MSSSRRERNHKPLPCEILEKQRQEKDYIGRIPDEILVNIFSFLNGPERAKISSVSKKWNKHANNETLWKRDCLQKGINLNPRLQPNYKELFIENCRPVADIYYIGDQITESELNSYIKNQKYKLERGIAFHTNREICLQRLTAGCLIANNIQVLFAIHIPKSVKIDLDITEDRNLVYGGTETHPACVINSDNCHEVVIKKIYKSARLDTHFTKLELPKVKDEKQETKGCIIA